MDLDAIRQITTDTVNAILQRTGRNRNPRTVEASLVFTVVNKSTLKKMTSQGE
jgi:hypothetical protein